MSIVGLETVRPAANENLLWLRVVTDDGIEGWGETFFAPSAVESFLHDACWPILAGADAGDIIRVNRQLVRYPVGYASSGVEMRAASAVDMALWDIAGKAAGMPLWRMLGGRSRESIRVYNTCAGPHYVRRQRAGDVDRWFGTDGPRHPLDDLRAFSEAPARLARELLDEGVTGMKIWPFDRAAFANGGIGITPDQLAEGVAPFRLIREAVGPAMDLMVELHALWDLASARRIVRAVEPFDPLWIEDPVRMDDRESLAVLARETRVPILACETLGPAASFLPMIAERSVGIVSCDPSWCGGITQARAIADMAAAAQLPLAVHDCTGPLGFVAGAHLSIHTPAAMIQETVRAYLRGWYAETVTALPAIAGGRMRPPEGPGLGARPKPEAIGAASAARRVSGAVRGET
jgi:L-alanine-DL-glutamate epimerase-like enolase superfamily enzyme